MKVFITVFTFILTGQLFSQSPQKLTLYFKSNKDQVETKAFSILQQTFKGKSVHILSVYAFADTIGSVQSNQSLSNRRLSATLNCLKTLNLIPDSTFAKGEISAFDLASARRVDIYYQEAIPPIQSTQTPSPKFSITNSDKESAIVLDVKFFGGTADMFPESLPEVDRLFEFLKENQKVTALIRGHVCCMDDYELSVKRAKAVYDALVVKGIDSKRLTFKGFSNTIPVKTPELTEEDRQLNRRVDVVFHR